MSYELAKAYVQIIPTTKGIEGELESALGSASSKAGSTSGSSFAGGFGKAVKTVAATAGAAMVAAGAGIASFTKSSVQAGMQFDSAMSQVAATMGTTVDQIDDLREFAQKMGASTAFSATEAAEALNYMALAGYGAQTSMDMLPNVLNLAAAGNIDLASASDMVTDAQSALGLRLDETTDMVDQMAKASSKSNTSVAQLGEAFLKIGATARNLSGGTQELSTMLGVLADNGIKGAEGGTHLRNILLSLQQAAEDGTVDFGDFSVAVYDSDGNMRSMIDIVKDMQDGLGDMSQEAKDAITSGVFNKTDLAAINALLGTSDAKFDKLYASIGDCAGAAQAMADTQLDNLSGDITLMKSAFEGLQIAISDGATPSIRDAVQGITEIINGVHDLVSGVEGGSDRIKTGFEQIVKGITEGLPNVLEIFGSIIEAVSDIFPDLLGMINQELPGFFNTVISAIADLIPGLMKILPDIIDTVLDMAESLAGKLDDIIMPIFKALPEIITRSVKKMDTVLPAIMESIGELAGQIIGELPEIVFTIIKELPTAIGTALKSIGSLIEGVFTGLFDSMRLEVSPDIQLKAEAASQMLADARDYIQELLDGGNYSVDWSFDVSTSGRSYNELETVIRDAKTNILAILQELNDQSAEKRQADLDNLSWYRSQMEIAYGEEKGILETKIEATLGILENGQELTTEQYASYVGRINSWVDAEKEIINSEYDTLVEEAIAEVNANTGRVEDLDGTVTKLEMMRQSELDGLQRYTAAAQGSFTDHNVFVAGAMDEMVNTLAGSFGEQTALLLRMVDENQDGFLEDGINRQEYIDNLAELMSRMVSDMDDNTQQAVASMWDMAFDMAAAGEQIPADMDTSMSSLLGVLSVMPDELDDNGKAMLKGLIEGTKFYENELASTWEDMTLNDVVEKVKNELGISGSSSDVMEELAHYAADGFTKGLGDKADEIAQGAGMTAEEFIRTIEQYFQIGSPSRLMQTEGEYVMQGFVNGVDGMQWSVNNTAYYLGQMLSSGIASGINSSAYWVTNAATRAVNNAIASAKAAAGIASPSKVMRDEVGLMITEGMALGITDGEDSVIDSVDSINDAMMNSWAGTVGAYDLGLSSEINSNERLLDADMAGSTSGSSLKSIVINVYGAEGQDEETIARKVAEIIQREVDRRGAVYA